ncbi:MAG: AAA family ATPase [Flavobacteriales bacterium]
MTSSAFFLRVIKKLQSGELEIKEVTEQKVRAIAWLYRRNEANVEDFLKAMRYDLFHEEDQLKEIFFSADIEQERSAEYFSDVLEVPLFSEDGRENEKVSQNLENKKWDSLKSELPRKANERLSSAKHLPPVKKLLGEFMAEGELHVLFADTGVGKSLLGVDIADHVSKGLSLMGLENECGPKTTIYYDFELSERQFRDRYSNDSDEEYIFSDNLYSDRISLKDENIIDICEYVFSRIAHAVDELQAEVVIVDNITYLVMQSIVDQDVAINLMRCLDLLKKEKGVSILVLAHTPKVDRALPLTINSLGGSKHISNFSDSVSAIGRSKQGIKIRYWKQIKCRQFEEVYTDSNVFGMEITKPDKKIEFVFLNTGSEQEHLPHAKADAKAVNLQHVLRLHSEGRSLNEITAETGVPRSTVSRWISENRE